PRFGADAGDFVALPDPATFAPLPYHDGIGRVMSYLYTEEFMLWEGCPRGRLLTQIEALAARELSAQAAFEPEFTLFRKEPDGQYAPVDSFTMYSVDRMEAEAGFLSTIETTLRQ